MSSPALAPRVTVARPSRSNGVLSIPASATQKRSGQDSESLNSKPASTRLKLIVRRLPPGLTQAEFEEALGDDWRVNGGKVDWAVYKEGKVSREYDSTLQRSWGNPTLIQTSQSCQTLKAEPRILAPDEARSSSPTLRACPQYHIQ